MPRAAGNDIAEIFGYAPDDHSEPARKQWKSQHCPFVGNVCIKQTDRNGGQSPRIWGTCSLLSRSRNRFEEVIACPQRFYANGYGSLKQVIYDATGRDLPVYTVHDHIQEIPPTSGVSESSPLCSSGSYFMVPEAVFLRFERLLGELRQAEAPARGVLTVLTYGLGPQVPHGQIRQLEYRRMMRTEVDDLALAFATAGDSNDLGELLEFQVRKRLLL